MSYNTAGQKVNIEMETGVTGHKSKGRSKLCTFVVVVVILALIALSIAGIYFMVKYSEESNSSQIISGNPPASCLEMKTNGDFSSNYYVIQPDSTLEPFLTYCDMETDGGGWTLVATVHESDVDKKCASDDVWVSNGGNTLSETRLWENADVMATPPDSATTRDYKNLGYSKLKASDVMVKHVPNGAAVSESGAKASLGYYTDNKFLEDYGGNLKSMFSDHFPLSPVTEDDQVFGTSVIDDMLDALVEKADAGGILNTTMPPELYEYVYNDSTPDRLTDGGNALFDPYGMQISVEAPNCTGFDLIYGQTYDCEELSSRKSFPFFALVKTNNATNATDPSELYTYIVTSFRTNTDDQRYEGSYISTESEDFPVTYAYKCRYSDSIPSYCDFWFTVYSENWGSESLLGNTISSTRIESATHTNAVYGYTMLAREPPSMTDHQFPYEGFMRNVVDVLMGFDDIDIQGMLDALAARGASLVDEMPDFREYTYDDVSPSRLTDGGGIFTPYGMEVELVLRDTDTNVTLDYGESYLLNDDLIQVSSRKSYPFFALARTENLDQVMGFRYTEGRSRLDNRKSVIADTGSLKMGNFVIGYYSSYSLNSSAPSVCDVIFFVRNEKEWNSKPLTIGSYSDSTVLSKTIDGVEYDFFQQASFNRYTNSITGYTLLAREPGSIYQPFPVEEVLLNILEVFTRFPSIASDCAAPSNNLVVPIKYINGNDESVTLQIPPELREFVTPGHLQFRATGYNGHVYAMCPAVQVSTCYSKFLCVGGVTKSSETTNDCSDFLDWSDSQNRNFSTPLPSEATGRMHSKGFTESTIMIFYR